MFKASDKARQISINRRDVLLLSGAAALAGLLPSTVKAATPQTRHGLSAFDDLKYPADFSHFAYVNPDAPKGGDFRFTVSSWQLNQSPETFNTLNSFSAKGDAPPRMELCFDSLMVRASDEPDAVYGLVAQSVEIDADTGSYIFNLRAGARFHDGSPLNAHDVAFSYQLLKSHGHPSIRLQLRTLLEAIAETDDRLRLSFSGDHHRRVVLDIVTLPVLSRSYYSDHSFEQSSLDIPLASGPYKVGQMAAGQFIEYQRVDDYWGKDLPVNRGLFNFDRIRIEFFRDRQPAFEAFKKGELDWRSENLAKAWASEYQFSAVTTGQVIRTTFPVSRYPSMQGWAINQRRERFRDKRVREAINLCFDFEWANKNLFYDSYQRLQSCFSNSDYMASGKASAEEQAIINSHAGLMDEQLKQALLDEPVMMPVSDGSGRNREHLRRAGELMQQAGFTRQGKFLADHDGKRFTLEILNNSEGFNRIYNPMLRNLQAIGIDASVRMAEAASYQARLLEFDFDMIALAAQLPATPTGETLENLFATSSATMPGSKNFPGITDPLIDALIAGINQLQSRQALTMQMRVLDRLLRYRRDWIPNWGLANQRISYWDKFDFIQPMPDYGGAPEQLWWSDASKAKQLGK